MIFAKLLITVITINKYILRALEKGVAVRLFEQSTLLERINGDVDHFLSITVDSDSDSDIYGTFYNLVDRNECDVISGRGAYRGCSRKLQ